MTDKRITAELKQAAIAELMQAIGLIQERDTDDVERIVRGHLHQARVILGSTERVFRDGVLHESMCPGLVDDSLCVCESVEVVLRHPLGPDLLAKKVASLRGAGTVVVQNCDNWLRISKGGIDGESLCLAADLREVNRLTRLAGVTVRDLTDAEVKQLRARKARACEQSDRGDGYSWEDWARQYPAREVNEEPNSDQALDATFENYVWALKLADEATQADSIQREVLLFNRAYYTVTLGV